MLCVRARVRLSHLNLLEGHGGVVHQVPGPVHLTELAPPNLLLNLEVSQRVVAHVRLKRLLQGRHRQHTVTEVGLHPMPSLAVMIRVLQHVEHGMVHNRLCDKAESISSPSFSAELGISCPEKQH